ncbi:MAG: VCBS repeat-containing protein [Blastochloris sp.]|nr:VCBS repeat-containing protein [Blastochloris sp.]
MLPTVDATDLLPPYQQPAYLTEEGVSWPYGFQSNTFLQNLNTNIDQLVDNLGIDNIYVIYGDGANTQVQYHVTPPPTTAPNTWRNGHVEESGVVRDTTGDDLIPTTSTTLLQNRLIENLPLDNEQVVTGPGSGHKEIMYHPDVQTRWVPHFLGAVTSNDNLPFQTFYQAPLATTNIMNLLTIQSDCPINMLITDPQGRRLGFDPATGELINEIPHAVYTSMSVEPQVLLIANPLSGTYQIDATGYDDGIYGIQVMHSTNDDIRLIDAFAGDIVPDQTVSHRTIYDSRPLPDPPPVTFAATPTLDVGPSAKDMATGDFDQDGTTDLALIYGNDRVVRVMLNNGDETFQAAVEYAIGPRAFSIMARDMNQDTYLDLVVPDSNSSEGMDVLFGAMAMGPLLRHHSMW